MDEQLRKHKFKARNNDAWRSHHLFVGNLKGTLTDESKKTKAALRSRGRPSEKRKRADTSKMVSKRLVVDDDVEDEEDKSSKSDSDGDNEQDDEESGSQYPASSQQVQPRAVLTKFCDSKFPVSFV